MADKLIRLSDSVSVMASAVTSVERAPYSDYVTVKTHDGGIHTAEGGYGEPPYKTQSRLIAEINYAISGPHGGAAK